MMFDDWFDISSYEYESSSYPLTQEDFIYNTSTQSST